MGSTNNNKYKKLAIGLLLDSIGFLSSSWVLPLIGDFSDIIWAPLAGWLMTRLYKGTPGKVAGVVAFIEEILPGMDVVPTFTIMWLYTYVFKEKRAKDIIELK